MKMENAEGLAVALPLRPATELRAPAAWYRWPGTRLASRRTLGKAAYGYAWSSGFPKKRRHANVQTQSERLCAIS